MGRANKISNSISTGAKTMKVENMKNAKDNDDEAIYYENHYHCSGCGYTWSDSHDCQCDDRCPQCNISNSPDESNEI